MDIAHGSQSIVPYLLARDAAKLIAFFGSAFGAREVMRMPNPDGLIMHAELVIGNSALELADGSAMYPAAAVALHLYVPDADAVYRQAVEHGAVSLRGPVDQSYGDREAGVVDPSGNHWWIATHQGADWKPAGFRSVTPYLMVKRADKLIGFLKAVLAAEEVSVTPSPDGAVVHAEVRVGNSIIEVSEARDDVFPGALHAFVDDVDAVYRRALEAGAAADGPPEDKPYGERAVTIRDEWGNAWFLAQVIG